MAASKTGSTYISSCRHDRAEIIPAISIFSRSSDPLVLSRIFYDLTGSGKYVEINNPEVYRNIWRSENTGKW